MQQKKHKCKRPSSPCASFTGRPGTPTPTKIGQASKQPVRPSARLGALRSQGPTCCFPLLIATLGSTSGQYVGPFDFRMASMTPGGNPRENLPAHLQPDRLQVPRPWEIDVRGGPRRSRGGPKSRFRPQIPGETCPDTSSQTAFRYPSQGVPTSCGSRQPGGGLGLEGPGCFSKDPGVFKRPPGACKRIPGSFFESRLLLKGSRDSKKDPTIGR